MTASGRVGIGPYAGRERFFRVQQRTVRHIHFVRRTGEMQGPAEDPGGPCRAPDQLAVVSVPAGIAGSGPGAFIQLPVPHQIGRRTAGQGQHHDRENQTEQLAAHSQSSFKAR